MNTTRIPNCTEAVTMLETQSLIHPTPRKPELETDPMQLEACTTQHNAIPSNSKFQQISITITLSDIIAI